MAMATLNKIAHNLYQMHACIFNDTGHGIAIVIRRESLNKRITWYCMRLPEHRKFMDYGAHVQRQLHRSQH